MTQLPFDSGSALDRDEESAWQAVLAGLRSSRRWQFWIKVVSILGGATIGAVGGAMEGPLWPATGHGLMLKGALVVFGAAMTLLGGILLLLADDDATGHIARARALAQAARRYLMERDALMARASTAETNAERLDLKRRERLSAIEQMLESVEAALLSGADAAITAHAMLESAIHSIRKAVEYEGGDFFTVTIFRREDDGKDGELRFIAGQLSDPARIGTKVPFWKRGKGYSGVAWNNAIGNPEPK